ncbi:MAG: hypothetical protein GX592_08275 [Clostridiales bacterium]|nr:hypothetical protein [Clostridiales bacterium]
MGNTFMSALIPKKGRLSAAVGHLKKAVAEVAGGEDTGLELRINGGDRFYVLNGVLVDPAGPEPANALLDAYARLSGMPALTICGYDSDVSMLRLSDGQRQSALLFGSADELEEGVPPYIEELWRPLFKTQEEWDALENLRDRQMRGVKVSEDAFFAETAVHQLAKALKFDGTAACGFPEESEAEVVWSSDEEVEQPRAGRAGMVADGEPPRFDEGLNGMTNPCKAGVYSAGGRGRGIEATILARGFDAALCEIPDVGLGAMWDNGRGRYVLLERPRRISAEEGKGWRVRFPDAEILPGSRRPERHVFDSPGYFLRFPVFGAEFAPKLFPFEGLRLELPTGEVGHWAGAGKIRIDGEIRPLPHFEVWFTPTENPAGGVRQNIALMQMNEEELDSWRKWRDYWEKHRGE